MVLAAEVGSRSEEMLVFLRLHAHGKVQSVLSGLAGLGAAGVTAQMSCPAFLRPFLVFVSTVMLCFH